MVKDKLPIGVEDFAEIRTEGFYYVDKTAMIRDLLDSRGKVNLFTRPRRFGKSLNMSMLKSFFEIGTDKSLFDGLEISKETELCEKYMGRYPVVSISLKGIEGTNYSTARGMAVEAINEEARRLNYIFDGANLTSNEKDLLSRLTDKNMEEQTLVSSLRNFTELLEKHYGKKVIVLIDEYDVPLAKASECGYYDEAIKLIRGMFHQALKTNPHLEFAVLTGCLRVAKESIFTGLNNPKILSITSPRFSECFGFTNDEVKKMLSYYNLEDKHDAIREWYDGYRFGSTNIYCPWDVVNCCDEMIVDHNAVPKNFWVNTSGNSVVRNFIESANNETLKKEIESLVAGEPVAKTIHEDITYKDLYSSNENVWSVLFATGCLTRCESNNSEEHMLKIPNREIREIFVDQIMELFKKDIAKDGERVNAFCDSLCSGDSDEVETIFGEYLREHIGIRDTFVKSSTKENYYHGILLGLLAYKADWYIKSNKESGEGFADIFIEANRDDVGIIIEAKYADTADSCLSECKNAISQIDEKGYINELKIDGCKTIYKYGIACYKKRCKVLCEKEDYALRKTLRGRKKSLGRKSRDER